jgi:hypothetical protein
MFSLLRQEKTEGERVITAEDSGAKENKKL